MVGGCPWDRHEAAAGERDAYRFALTAVGFTVAERSTRDAMRRDPGEAVGTRHVAVHERRYHQVAFGDAVDVGADVLDDADELVADRPDGVRRLDPTACGDSPRWYHRSEPHTQPSTTRTIASVDSTMTGADRSPTVME